MAEYCIKPALFHHRYDISIRQVLNQRLVKNEKKSGNFIHHYTGLAVCSDGKARQVKGWKEGKGNINWEIAK